MTALISGVIVVLVLAKVAQQQGRITGRYFTVQFWWHAGLATCGALVLISATSALSEVIGHATAAAGLAGVVASGAALGLRIPQAPEFRALHAAACGTAGSIAIGVCGIAIAAIGWSDAIPVPAWIAGLIVTAMGVRSTITFARSGWIVAAGLMNKGRA